MDRPGLRTRLTQARRGTTRDKGRRRPSPRGRTQPASRLAHPPLPRAHRSRGLRRTARAPIRPHQPPERAKGGVEAGGSLVPRPRRPTPAPKRQKRPPRRRMPPKPREPPQERRPRAILPLRGPRSAGPAAGAPPRRPKRTQARPTLSTPRASRLRRPLKPPTLPNSRRLRNKPSRRTTERRRLGVRRKARPRRPSEGDPAVGARTRRSRPR